MQWGKNLTALFLGYQKWQVLDAAKYSPAEREQIERIYLAMRSAVSALGSEALNRSIDLDSHFVNDFGMKHTIPPDEE